MSLIFFLLLLVSSSLVFSDIPSLFPESSTSFMSYIVQTITHLFSLDSAVIAV